jgi:hypothetical protein
LNPEETEGRGVHTNDGEQDDDKDEKEKKMTKLMTMMKLIMTKK